MLLADVLDEIERAREAADGRPVLLALWRVAAQREDVHGEALLLDARQRVLDHVHLHVGARQVHHGLNAHLVLHAARHVERQLRRRAARAPGDVAEQKAGARHAVHALEAVLDAVRARARREVLEAEEPLAARVARRRSCR